MRRSEPRPLVFTVASMSLVACGNTETAPEPPGWRIEAQSSGVTSSLRGLSVVSDEVVWIGAPDGQVLRSVDGGSHWEVRSVALAEGADLRSAHGFDDAHALFITAGQPARIIETRDGGTSFRVVWDDADGSAFFDSLAFWDDRRGLAFSDPVEGRFLILRTLDGGGSWHPLDNLPEPLPDEAGFAASNSSIALSADGCAFVGTGGAARARVLRSCDFGDSWVALDTPIAAGSAGSGIFALSLDASGRLGVSGGDYQQPDYAVGNFAASVDQGEHWITGGQPPAGYRSGLANQDGLWLAVGTTGVDWAGPDLVWHATAWDMQAPNAVAFSPSGARGWIVGGGGEVWRLSRSQ